MTDEYVCVHTRVCVCVNGRVQGLRAFLTYSFTEGPKGKECQPREHTHTHTHTHTHIYTLALQRKTTLSFMLFMCQGASAKTNPYHRPLTMILDTLNTDAQTYMFIQRCTEELFCSTQAHWKYVSLHTFLQHRNYVPCSTFRGSFKVKCPESGAKTHV